MNDEFVTASGIKLKIVPEPENNAILVCGPKPFSSKDEQRKCSECGAPVYMSEQFQALPNIKVICPICFLTDHWTEDTQVQVTRKSFNDVMDSIMEEIRNEE